MLLKEFLKKIGRKEFEILEISDESSALEAVKNSGDALRYVKKSCFK